MAKEDLLAFMETKMKTEGLKKGRNNKFRRGNRRRNLAKAHGNSAPVEEEEKLNDEDKAKLEDIKKVTIEHGVPEMYQDDMSNQILDQGQE